MSALSKKIPCLVFIILFYTLNIYSKNDLTIFIPNNADIVISLNLKNIYSKSQIDNNEFYKELFKNLTKESSDQNQIKIYEYLKDISSIGIDKNAVYHLYFFDMAESTPSFGFLCPMLDKEKLKKFFIETNTVSDIANIKIKNGFYYFCDKGLVAWNDKVLFMLIDNSIKIEDEYLNKYDYIFKQTSKNSLINNAVFKNIQAEEWDASTWINIGTLVESYINKNFDYLSLADKESISAQENKRLYEKYENQSKMQNEKNRFYDSPLTGEEYAELGDYENAAKWFKDEYDTSIKMYNYYKGLHDQYAKINSEAIKNYQDMIYTNKINFLNGNVVLSNKILTGGNIKLPVTEKNNFSKDTIDMIPKNFIFCLFGNVNLKNLYNEFKKLQFGDIAQGIQNFEKLFNDSPIKSDEFLEFFSEDFSLSFSDYVKERKSFNLIYALKIKNKNLLDKFINYHLNINSIQEQSVGNIKVYTLTNLINPQLYYIIKDDIFYITTIENKELLILNKSNSIAINKNMIDITNKNFILGFFNFYNFVKQVFDGSSSLTGTSEKYNEIINIFEDKISNINADLYFPTEREINLDINIEFNNSNENSLKLLVDWIMAYILVKRNK